MWSSQDFLILDSCTWYWCKILHFIQLILKICRFLPNFLFYSTIGCPGSLQQVHTLLMYCSCTTTNSLAFLIVYVLICCIYSLTVSNILSTVVFSVWTLQMTESSLSKSLLRSWSSVSNWSSCDWINCFCCQGNLFRCQCFCIIV